MKNDFTYRGIDVRDWPEHWMSQLHDALDWMHLQDMLVPCRIVFKRGSRTRDYGEYFSKWNSISIYDHTHTHVDALLVHELVHALQEVRPIPEKYFIDFPPPDTRFSRYILSPSEYHAYSIEAVYRQHCGYPTSESLEEYALRGIQLQEVI